MHINFINTATGTAISIPATPKYAPPTVTENTTSSGVVASRELVIFGFIIFASICCKITVITSVINACFHPPVKMVINATAITAIMAPKYGTKLNTPITIPSKTAYFTLIIDRAILIITATTQPSSTWLEMYFKKISAPFEKYLLNL